MRFTSHDFAINQLGEMDMDGKIGGTFQPRPSSIFVNLHRYGSAATHICALVDFGRAALAQKSVCAEEEPAGHDYLMG